MKLILDATVSRAVLILLFTDVLTSACSIQLVESQGTIYIRPDGTVDPSTAPIQRYRNLYTLTGNITSDDGIVIERDNVTLDGAGYTLQGTSIRHGIGIDLSERSNVTIKNIEITTFLEGVDLSWSSNNTMAGNKIAKNTCGILFAYSSNNSLFGNHIIDNYIYGILFSTSSYTNTFRDNNLAGNNYHLGDDGAGDIILNDIDTSNTVDGKPIYCVTDKHDLLVDHSTFPHGVGYLELVNCSNVVVRGLTLTHNERGLYLRHTNNTIIENVTVSNNKVGIFAYAITNCTISANHVNKNEYFGIYMYSSHGNMIGENTIYGSIFGCILLQYSSNNSIEGNYWSDHNPPDEDLDKIGDVPYVIDENNLDRYPLIYPYGFVPKPDVNEDGRVNMLDLHVIAGAFGTKPGIDRWDPIADVEMDEIINIRDMYVVAKNYGKT